MCKVKLAVPANGYWIALAKICALIKIETLVKMKKNDVMEQ